MINCNRDFAVTDSEKTYRILRGDSRPFQTIKKNVLPELIKKNNAEIHERENTALIIIVDKYDYHKTLSIAHKKLKQLGYFGKSSLNYANMEFFIESYQCRKLAIFGSITELYEDNILRKIVELAIIKGCSLISVKQCLTT